MIAILLTALLIPSQGAHKSDPEIWEKTVTKGIEYLRNTQAPDGSWSAKASPGITGIVLTGLLRTGKITADDLMAKRAFGYIESLVNPEAGHIAGKDPKARLQNYVTCVNVMALVEANRESYRPIIKDAGRFLRQIQWDEGEGKDAHNPNYGGAGYDGSSRPDLSNTQMLLDALVAAGIPKEDPAFKKALVFVSRCQNLASEYNDQPLAGKINDGSFTYTPLTGERSVESVPGYGSMTYAGIKSMIYCNTDANDPRMRKAMEWVLKHYDLDKHPGMPSDQATSGLFYYYDTLSKCLDVAGISQIRDSKGVEHSWRQELTAKLASMQKPDGSWANKPDRFMEGNPDLATGYALLALAHAKGVARAPK